MTNQIKIERGIKLPPRAKSNGLMAALRRMNNGDSFVTESSLRNNAYCAARLAGIKIAIRALPDNRMKIRVWRTA